MSKEQQKEPQYQDIVLPDWSKINLSSVTMLPIKRMFEFGRKHPQISMVSFAQHWPTLILETMKKAISPEILGYHTRGSKSSTYYPTKLTPQLYKQSIGLEKQLFYLLLEYRQTLRRITQPNVKNSTSRKRTLCERLPKNSSVLERYLFDKQHANLQPTVRQYQRTFESVQLQRQHSNSTSDDSVQ